MDELAKEKYRCIEETFIPGDDYKQNLIEYHRILLADMDDKIDSKINLSYLQLEASELCFETKKFHNSNFNYTDFEFYLLNPSSILQDGLLNKENDPKGKILNFLNTFYNTTYPVKATLGSSLMATQVRTRQTDLQEIENEIKELRTNVEEFKQDFAKQSAKLEATVLKDATTQMIAITSIFVGIAFVMFGGLTLINDLFEYKEATPVPMIELICLGSLVGIIMIVVMYCFILFMLISILFDGYLVKLNGM